MTVFFIRLPLKTGSSPRISRRGKNAVRDYLRERDREEQWTEMQGAVYGARIMDAEPYPGIEAFFAYCRSTDMAICIVSHKTRFPYRGPRYDLHEAGHGWLQARGFLNTRETGLSSSRVHFELTKEEKIARIAALKCTHFIDDLPEILLADGMPSYTKKILFDPQGSFPDMHGLCRMTSWRNILDSIRPEGEIH